jgi:hypothetical protein
MAETGQLAARVGREKGFEIREYPVPDPAPGAALINETFRQQEDGHITRGAIAPN